MFLIGKKNKSYRLNEDYSTKLIGTDGISYIGTDLSAAQGIAKELYTLIPESVVRARPYKLIDTRIESYNDVIENLAADKKEEFKTVVGDDLEKFAWLTNNVSEFETKYHMENMTTNYDVKKNVAGTISLDKNNNLLRTKGNPLVLGNSNTIHYLHSMDNLFCTPDGKSLLVPVYEKASAESPDQGTQVTANDIYKTYKLNYDLMMKKLGEADWKALEFPDLRDEDGINDRLSKIYAENCVAVLMYNALSYGKWGEYKIVPDPDMSDVSDDDKAKMFVTDEVAGRYASLGLGSSLNFWMTNHHVAVSKSSSMLDKMYTIMGLNWHEELFSDKAKATSSYKNFMYMVAHRWDARTMLAKVYPNIPNLCYLQSLHMPVGKHIQRDQVSDIRANTPPAGTAKIMVPFQGFETAVANEHHTLFPSQTSFKKLLAYVWDVSRHGAAAHTGHSYLCHLYTDKHYNINSYASEIQPLLNELMYYISHVLKGSTLSKSPIVSDVASYSANVPAAFKEFVQQFSEAEIDSKAAKTLATLLSGKSLFDEEDQLTITAYEEADNDDDRDAAKKTAKEMLKVKSQKIKDDLKEAKENYLVEHAGYIDLDID